MKKICLKIAKFFKAIGKFIDKKIILPFTKLITLISNKFGQPSKRFEVWLSKTNTLLFISLIFALGLFIMVDQKILFYSESSAEVLKSQSVTALYNAEAYVVEGLPETVDITLIGSKADLYIAKQSTSHEVVVDLTGLKPGQHKVNIKYNQANSAIDYKVNPSVATVMIYQKISQAKTLTVDILNQDVLDSKLSIANVDVSTDSVVVKGAEHQLAKVAAVKALVDVNNLPSQSIGEVTMKDVPLKAYDQSGNVVDVEIVPATIDAKVTIASPSKEIPIKVIPKGDVAFGKAISSIETSETKVTVYGNSDVLNSLNYLPVEIDVNELKENREYKVQLENPVGIKAMSTTTITVSVTLDNVADKDIENVAIEYRNLGSGYTVQGLSASDVMVTVNVKGVASVINGIQSTDIVAYLDLSGYGEGEHEVDVNVEGNDVKVQYQSKTKKVKIRIVKK